GFHGFYALVQTSDHTLGTHPKIVFLWAYMAQPNGLLPKSGHVFMGRVGNLRSFVIAYLGVQCSDQHQGIVQKGLDYIMIGLYANRTVQVETDTGIPEQSCRLQDRKNVGQGKG